MIDVYPEGYRKCSQVCGAELGKPCVSRSGRVVAGRPDGVRTVLLVPHKSRKRRVKTLKPIV